MFGMSSHLEVEAWAGNDSVDSGVFDRYADMCKAFAGMIRGEIAREVDLETEARIQRCLSVACGIPCDHKAKISL